MPADALSHLVAILGTSPVMYLADSGIWSYPGDESLKLALADVVAAQRGIVARATGLLEEREIALPQSGYPLSYTAWHDLDVSFLLPRVIEGLHRQAAAIEGVRGTADDAAAVELAEEAAAVTRGHIDALEQQRARLCQASTPA